MSNRLEGQMSPYLLQHAQNPVNWYPWCEEAFEKARFEQKPIFLSIGYSTCHWCHVMAHESFEDERAAELLNRYFVAVKVDKEERPDIDQVYMSVCQAFTGSGGWPLSIFMTPEKKPFFAGTYFPRESRQGGIGFLDLLVTVHERWETNRVGLIHSAEEITAHLGQNVPSGGYAEDRIIRDAAEWYQENFDKECGGFGLAPKFPAPHNLLLLMETYETNGDSSALEMAEKTLLQMYRGGLFDHIGYGFSRYSTDRFFLVPHFEKMLYDNAFLILAYSKAYSITKKDIYKDIAEKTADYVLRELTDSGGAFYCAQDADSEGIEGKYYVFAPQEVKRLLGASVGEAFNHYYDITQSGNFEGKNIPNLLQTQTLEERFSDYLPILRKYRKSRSSLHLDDKILTSWNAMMITALTCLYRVSRDSRYLCAAKKAEDYLNSHLREEDTLYASCRKGIHGAKGFLDDYAYYIMALISLYEATLDNNYMKLSSCFMRKAVSDFSDSKDGGFFLSGKQNEPLIFRAKETYDGAVPSGNSVMTYNLVKLSQLIKKEEYLEAAEKQIKFMIGAAASYPVGYSFFLLALSKFRNPPESIVVVLQGKEDLTNIEEAVGLNVCVTILDGPTPQYTLLNNMTTYYVCRNHTCLPPTNKLK